MFKNSPVINTEGFVALCGDGTSFPIPSILSAVYPAARYPFVLAWDRACDPLLPFPLRACIGLDNPFATHFALFSKAHQSSIPHCRNRATWGQRNRFIHA